jgi:hypothetical protein
MTKDLVSLISFLEGDEVQVLKKQLDENKIIYLINKHGGSVGYEDSDYYEIKVSPVDYTRSKVIIGKFKASSFNKSQKCPRCGSLSHKPVKTLNLFQKIFFLGTTPVKCKKCKKVFTVR